MDTQNRAAEYELVRRGRELCNQVNGRISDKTKADYIKKYGYPEKVVGRCLEAVSVQNSEQCG